jgi:hypothetical protein
MDSSIIFSQFVLQAMSGLVERAETAYQLAFGQLKAAVNFEPGGFLSGTGF